MTPERRQQLMHEAAKELRGRWGEVQPDALRALADDVRVGVIENGASSVGDILSEVTRSPHSEELFGRVAPFVENVSDKQRDVDLER